MIWKLEPMATAGRWLELLSMASAVTRLGSNWLVSITLLIPDTSRLRVIECVLCIWQNSSYREGEAGIAGWNNHCRLFFGELRPENIPLKKQNNFWLKELSLSSSPQTLSHKESKVAPGALQPVVRITTCHSISWAQKTSDLGA